MKRIFIIGIFLLVSSLIQAQVSNIYTILGYWETESVEDTDWDYVRSIFIKEDGTCEYSTVSKTYHCGCAILSGGGTSGSKSIHLFSTEKDYEGNDKLTIINLRIGWAGPGKLCIGEFNSNLVAPGKFAVLTKKDPSDIRAVPAESAKNSTKYNLKGVATEYSRGVYIQSGKVILDK